MRGRERERERERERMMKYLKKGYNPKGVYLCETNKKKKRMNPRKRNPVCPRSLDPFFILTYYMKWAKTSWTFSRILECVPVGINICIIDQIGLLQYTAGPLKQLCRNHGIYIRW